MSQINKIAVISAGNMGSGIAQKIAQEGINVVMVDIKEELVERGINTIRQTLKEAVERKILNSEQLHDVLSRIIGTCDFEIVADADLVIEAVFEDKQVKFDLFDKLDRICSDKTILATNTSSFYVHEFADNTSRPDRFIGLHYFYHPAKNRLLEVIPHEKTSAATVEKSLLAAKLHGKTAIVVKDAPGFAVNRFFVPFLNEAARMLEEDVADIPTIEEAAKQAFKIGMGPFELMNVTGIPIAVHASTTLGNELGPFYATAEIIKDQKDQNENWDLSGDVDDSKLEEVKDRFYGVCLGVAAALVDEGVASIEDTDRGAKIGLRWLMGPFEIMNKIGVERTHAAVASITEKYADFKMPQILVRQKKLGVPFAFRFVDLEIKGHIATITLNRPEAMNALNDEMTAEILAVLKQYAEDPKVKGFIITGYGTTAFSAGADVGKFPSMLGDPEASAQYARDCAKVQMFMDQMDKPVVAAVNGLALGGGLEIAIRCHSMVATKNATLQFPEISLGILPGIGGCVVPYRKWPQGADLFHEMICLAKPIGADEAAGIGMISRSRRRI